jgi:hypothetical protein
LKIGFGCGAKKKEKRTKAAHIFLKKAHQKVERQQGVHLVKITHLTTWLFTKESSRPNARPKTNF